MRKFDPHLLKKWELGRSGASINATQKFHGRGATLRGGESEEMPRYLLHNQIKAII